MGWKEYDRLNAPILRYMMTMRHISRVNEDQIAFGKKLGLDLRGNTVAVALARIEDSIYVGFHRVADLGKPTQKQIELAANFGHDISDLSYREGCAVIDDLMHELNLETIKNEKLAPGVKVINVHDIRRVSEVISSIYPDGTCYLKGGNGKRAWARSLRRIEKA